MTITDVLLFVLGAAVSWPLSSIVFWFLSRKTIRSLFGRAPWNWRVLMGPYVYHNWMERN